MFRRNKSLVEGKPPRKKEATPNVISQGTHILGNIISDGIIDFDGNIDGNIRCSMLTVRENGIVKGEVTAENVLVYGKIHGLIRAKHAHLFGTCHIDGIVMHESLTIEDGAFIDGKCKRTNKVLEAKTEEESDDSTGSAPLKILENIRLIR